VIIIHSMHMTPDTTTDHTTDGRLALTPEEAAQAIGIGRTKIYELLANGRIRSVKVGRRLVVPMSAIDAFLAGNNDGDGHSAA
jgi:excisionase family DNA binding protein